MDSRQRLIEAMESLLWERGYAATSPRDVMDRAEVGQGSMYHHFSGKHELAVEALSVAAGEMAGESSVLEGEGSPLTRIKRYLSLPRPGTRGCRVGRMTQDPQVVADADLIAIVADAFNTMLGRWEQAIAAAIAAGELPASIVPGELARTLAAVIQGGYVLARAQQSPGADGRSHPGRDWPAERAAKQHQRGLGNAGSDFKTGADISNKGKLMTVRVGINGFGRIGRSYLRAALASKADVEVVAVNDITDVATLASLLEWDSISGHLDSVRAADDRIEVGGQSIRVFSQRDPSAIPWSTVGADIVIESTGRFTDADSARAHLAGGARKVLISAPAKGDVPTFVLGVNSDALDAGAADVFSNGSCTTNCLATAGEGAKRFVRPRVRVDDDGSCLHQRPAVA